MIGFSCRCGYAFSVADELAGGVTQCPQCKKLNDVPLLSDLGRLEDGGIYKIGDVSTAPPQPDLIDELTSAFTRDHYDSQGNAFDLRGSAGAGPVPVESLAAGESAPPKYDPITGELVREIDVKPTENVSHLPTAQRAVVAPPTVIDGLDVPGALETVTLPLRLLRPINLFVMFIILVAHALCFLMMAAIGTNYFMLAPFWLMFECLIVAHYGNVIDEIGPASRSELPTPLRHVQWHEDMWGPFTQILTAMVICYGPGSVLLTRADATNEAYIVPISAGLSILGTLFVPATLLTTCTSGSILNARPDRLVAVAMICGVEYLLSLIVWVVGGTLSIIGIFGGNLLGSALLSPVQVPRDLTRAVVGGSLVLGTYLMHFFCWHLGLLYRKHHQQFPWLYQRHSGPSRSAASKGFPVQRPPRRPRNVSMRVEPIQDSKTE